MKNENQKYVIGVDGGGAKTVSVLADLKGKILARAKTGSSSPRNVGLKMAMDNVALAIKKVLRGRTPKISASFLGLPTMEEEFKCKENIIKKELLKRKEISLIFKGRVIIGSDQLVGFRSGTEEKEGVVLIAGTGCVAHGWRAPAEAHASGWGWLADEGSAFWIGQRVFQFILKSFDGRGPKTILKDLVFKEFKIRKIEDLINLIYLKNPTEIIPLFSVICDEAGKKGDKIAKNILTEAGKELAIAVNSVARQLDFEKLKFPLVLIGSVFESKIVLNTVKKEVKKFAPGTNFIRPKVEPVMGAVRLALEQIKNYGKIN